MDKPNEIKEAVNYALTLRGLPLRTTGWITGHMAMDVPSLIMEALPPELRDDPYFTENCLKDCLRFLESVRNSGSE